jgi:protein gp37
MVASTTIEWTNTTWNPVRGCSRISPGCVHCYAERMAHRFSGEGQPYEGLTRSSLTGPRWTGEIETINDLLGEPHRWREPRLVFVNSMSDLFHERVPDSFIRRVFDVMASVPRHTFQILTKRADRLASLSPTLPWPSNVWMGVSVESMDYVERIELLGGTEAHVKFLSLEPLLGPLPSLPLLNIDWVIVGGESGPGAREMKEEWVQAIHDLSHPLVFSTRSHPSKHRISPRNWC